jgi:hypothetical protein
LTQLAIDFGNAKIKRQHLALLLSFGKAYYLGLSTSGLALFVLVPGAAYCCCTISSAASRLSLEDIVVLLSGVCGRWESDILIFLRDD